jgi:hypothetical protein
VRAFEPNENFLEMTLCAVWTDGFNLQMSSDSRLMVADFYADTSVKVQTVPISILEPSSRGLHEQKAQVTRTYGMCAAGDVAPTMAIKDSLRVLMSSVWAVPGHADLSMDSLVSIVANMLERIWYKCADGLGNDTLADVAFVGYCPRQRRQRFFMLNTNAGAYPAHVEIREIDPTETGFYFGSGRPRAEALSGERPELSPAEVVRAIANNPEVRSVGGRVQYGRMDGENFRVCSVIDYDVDHEAKTLAVGYYLAGVELQGQDQPALPEGYHLLPPAVDPFRRQAEELAAAGYAYQGYGGEEGIQLIGGPQLGA